MRCPPVLGVVGQSGIEAGWEIPCARVNLMYFCRILEKVNNMLFDSGMLSDDTTLDAPFL